MKKHIILSIGIVLLLLCFIYGFQKKPKPPQQEEHEVEVRLVMVDVIVTKARKFVTDLTMDEFELYEDGKKVPINSFELISFEERKVVTVEEKPAEEITPARPLKKLVVVFDEVNSVPRHLKRGSKKIVNELISLVKLGHEILIIEINTEKGVEILQPFTTNEKLIRESVAKATGDIWVEKSIDSLKMAKDVGIESTGDQARVQRKLGKGAQLDALSWDYELIKHQNFEISMGGILAVFNMIKNLPGRKSILLISDGFPKLPDLPSEQIKQIRIIDPFNILKKEKNMSGYEVIQELIRYANAQNISIYTLDPGTFTEYFFTVSAGPGSSAEAMRRWKSEKLISVQDLNWISEDTGAVSLRGAKKFDRFKKVMETDLNYYYQLSYYPPRRKADNKYHKIDVKVKRSGVDVRSRKGYTDYSDEEKVKMLLLSAYYNPELYKDLPFEAEFTPFSESSKKYKPWMSIALPVKELFKKGGVKYGLKVFNLHIWVQDRERGGSAYKGQINIPLNIDSSFMELVEAMDYFSFHSTGPEIGFSQQEYQVIFALYDDQTEEIGTWGSSFSLPDFKENKQGAIINCVLGSLTPNPDKGKKPFSLSKKGGSLEYGEMKFFPAVTNQFQVMQDASVFLQVYLPQGKIEARPEFSLLKEDSVLKTIPGEISAEDWNEESNVWNGIFNLDLRSVSPGDYTLKVNLPLSEEGNFLGKEVKLIKLDY